MSVTIAEAYKNHYLAKSASIRKMSQSTFASLKPLFIRSIAETPIRGCKCEYCQNFGLLRETLIASGFKAYQRTMPVRLKFPGARFEKLISVMKTSMRNHTTAIRFMSILNPMICLKKLCYEAVHWVWC